MPHLWKAFAFVLGVIVPFAAGTAKAGEILTYTGNDYTSTCIVPIAGGCNTGSPYTTSDSITGEITLTSALAGNLSAFVVSDISSYSFNDGIGTIWNSSDSVVSTFQVGTDSLGNITTWELLLESGGGAFNGIVLVTCGGTGLTIGQCSTSPEDFADISLPPPNSFTYGFNQNDQGTWSVAATSLTPEPSSFGLAMMGALLFFGAALCQRKIQPTRAEIAPPRL